MPQAPDGSEVPQPADKTGKDHENGAEGLVSAAGAAAALRRGEAVVLPNPAPLTFVVAATDARTVNRAKGRPEGQAVALWVHDPATFAALDDTLDLDSDLRAATRLLLTEQRVTLLVPLRPGATGSDWLAPAARESWAMLFGTRWPPLLPVLADHSVLYVSSANRTGRPPAATAAQARDMFPDSVPVLSAEQLPGTDSGPDTTPRAATTTLRLYPDARIVVHRRGAQDAAFTDPDRYLAHLRALSPGLR